MQNLANFWCNMKNHIKKGDWKLILTVFEISVMPQKKRGTFQKI